MASKVPEKLHPDTLAYIKNSFSVIDGVVTRYDGYTGGVNTDGALQFKINVDSGRLTITSHHIAWLLYYGEWPTKEIDHKDRNKLNNSKDNLRCVSSVLNNLNRSGKKSGLPPGLKLKDGRYEVYMTISGVKTYIGSSKDMLIAMKIYRDMHLACYGEDVYELLDYSRWTVRGESEI